MAVDLSPIDESLLAEIANIHGMPKGAFNIRKDGQLVERHSSANIEIATKSDNPGIDITIAPGTKGETVFIPVIVTQSGLKDVVYNTFYIGDDCDVTIVAGCGIHNESHQASEHDGIHTFYCGKNSHVKYVEKHYGEGTGTGERILNPVTNVVMQENATCEMELTQLRGVSSTVRDTNAELGAGAKLGPDREAAHARRPDRHVQHEDRASRAKIPACRSSRAALRRIPACRCSTRWCIGDDRLPGARAVRRHHHGQGHGQGHPRHRGRQRGRAAGSRSRHRQDRGRPDHQAR